MLNEQVRGSVPDPSFLSLPGVEQVRALARGLIPATPLARLLGFRVTQVSSGTVVFNQPVSRWLEVYESFVDLAPLAETVVHVAALTTVPAATSVRSVSVALRYLRPCTADNEAVIARGRVLHAGSSFTTVEVLIEDTRGRALAHVTGSVVASRIDTPPPLSRDLAPIDEPAYAGPDPPFRPVPQGTQRLATGVPAPRIAEFLGAELAELPDGTCRASMPAGGWFRNLTADAAPGILMALAGAAAGVGYAARVAPDESFTTVNFNSSFLSPLPADGRVVTASARVAAQRNKLVVGEVQVSDDSAEPVAVVQPTLLARISSPRRSTAERVLLTVLFTDLVDSTPTAHGLGDAGWHELLQEHHTLVRRQLELHKGHEVKTTGDGFLATFDSPTRAAQCAMAIRSAVGRLDLKIRAGLHTGECEVAGGDVSGLAVHIASRLQSAAQPGEILVSGTVRELTSGSGLGFSDRGARSLKGLDGEWHLYGLER